MKKIFSLMLIVSFSILPAFAGICEDEAYSKYECDEAAAYDKYSKYLLNGGWHNMELMDDLVQNLDAALADALGSLQSNLAGCALGMALKNKTSS
jgi:hypothetical protein